MTGTYVPQTEWLVHDWLRACVSAGGLCVQRCASRGAWRHPPRRFCAECHSDDASFEPVCGHDVVASLAVSHRSLDPGWQERAPYASLVVELDDGPRVLTGTHASPTEVAIGDAVVVTVEPRGEEFVLLWADPA